MPETATPHIGRKIERIRSLKGIKQETLATEMGVTQATISKIEQSESLTDDKLEQIAKALGVSADAIKNFNEDAAVNNINTFHDSSAFNFQCQFNPIDKIVELYERLLASEREKNKILETQQQKRES